MHRRQNLKNISFFLQTEKKHYLNQRNTSVLNTSNKIFLGPAWRKENFSCFKK